LIIPTPYKNFTYLLELERDFELFEDEFNEVVLKNVDIKYYKLIEKFIQSILEIYTLFLYEVSEERDSNVAGKLTTENNCLKNLFLRLLKQQSITQAVDVLLLKNGSKKLDDSFTAKLEVFASKSFSKYNLSTALKEDIINSKIAKFLSNEKNINGLVRYLQKEILGRINDANQRFEIGKIDNELLSIEDEVLSFQKKVLKQKLLNIIESCEFAEEFWEKY
jgi:hypothetical protein